MGRIINSVYLLSCLCISALAISRPRGVSLEKASFYQANRDFRCLTDGKTIPFDHVNDDYCDCGDGSDEPGTSACENGLFYCENKAYKGKYVKSSRVNDGICDCCDGSDEFAGIISCPNTCQDLNQKERAEQEVLRQQQSEGYKVKQEYMQQGKRSKDEKLSKLSELEGEKDKFVSDKDAAEAAKNVAEEPEKAALEEHKNAWELIKEEKQKARDAEVASKAFEVLDANQDGKVDYPELMKHKEFDIDSDGTVSEEEAKEYLEESEEVDLTKFTEKIWPNIKEIYKLEEQQEDVAATEPVEVTEAADTDVDSEQFPDSVVEGGSPEHVDIDEDQEDIDDYEKDDEEEEDEDEDSEASYDIANSHKTEPAASEEDQEPPHSEQTKLLIAEADEARKKFEEAERKVRDVEHEINDIKKYLELDFGPNEEFAALKGECFEYTDREYTYRLCPYDKTTQKNKNGGMETSLGNWGKWHGPDDDKYDVMKYENGQGCWNGPSRSTHVNLHCGSVNEVTSASEPSRCEYHFEFTTPARCQPPAPIDVNDTHDEL